MTLLVPVCSGVDGLAYLKGETTPQCEAVVTRIGKPTKLVPQPAPRLTMSWSLVVLELIYATIHNDFRLTQVLHPTKNHVVMYIQSLGPFWVCGFGVVGLALAASLISRRFVATAHALSAGLWATYASALWWGSICESPGGPIAFAVMATAIVVFCLIMTWVYASWEKRRA